MLPSLPRSRCRTATAFAPCHSDVPRRPPHETSWHCRFGVAMSSVDARQGGASPISHGASEAAASPPPPSPPLPSSRSAAPQERVSAAEARAAHIHVAPPPRGATPAPAAAAAMATAAAANDPDATPGKMNVVLAHTTADFDSLAAAVGLARVWADEMPHLQTYVCVPRGAHPAVQHFLALHKSLFPVIGLRDVRPEQLHRVGMVDAQRLDRVGPAAPLVSAAEEVHIYDHHLEMSTDIDGANIVIEKVGSVTTIIAELLQARGLSVPPEAATLMCLGIHSDTGSLTYDSATPRDAQALAWLMGQGASQQAVAEYGHAALSREQQSIMADAFQGLNRTVHNGATVATTLIQCDGYVNGMARVAQNIMDATDADVLLLGAFYAQRRGRDPNHMVVIGRARARVGQINLDRLFKTYGGGGHAKAAAASFRLDDPTLPGGGLWTPQEILEELAAGAKKMITKEEVAEDIMTAPVLTCSPDALVDDVGAQLERHDIRGMPVVSADRRVVGMVSYREVAKARSFRKGGSAVKGWMAPHFAHALAHQPLQEVEHLVVQSDAGRVPVLDANGRLVGLITRTDLLRQHHYYDGYHYHNKAFADPIDSPQRRLLAELRKKLKRFDD